MVDAPRDVEGQGEDKEKGSGLSDSLRRAFVSGVSALSMTEEGIRNALADMRLPKEALTYLAQQTDRTRKELFRTVSAEVKSFLKDVDLSGALRKALLGLKLQVKADVSFVEGAGRDMTIKTTIKDVKARKPKISRRTPRGP